MTSNIGASEIMQDKVDDAINELKKYLKPEFINRVDEIITFNPISDDVIFEIVDKLLKEVSERLLNEGYEIKLNDSKIIDKIINEAYDKTYGARPIKRYIQKEIENFLASKILSNEIKKHIPYVIKLLKNGQLEVKLSKAD
jgi:ATP-dependent Clp protease ATP-binding subunit ClpB